MANCKPIATPLPEKTILKGAMDEEVEAVQDYPYLQVISSIMYAMLGTRPDIAYVTTGSPHSRNGSPTTGLGLSLEAGPSVTGV